MIVKNIGDYDAYYETETDFSPLYLICIHCGTKIEDKGLVPVAHHWATCEERMKVYRLTIQIKDQTITY